MAYRNSYRSGSRRSGSSSSGRGSRWMPLRFAGTCKVCGAAIAAGAQGFWDASARTVTCERLECCAADGLTTERSATGPWEANGALRVTERAAQRVGAPAPSSDPFARTRSRGYYGPGAGRCEDAPCCGCC